MYAKKIIEAKADLRIVAFISSFVSEERGAILFFCILLLKNTENE